MFWKRPGTWLAFIVTTGQDAHESESSATLVNGQTMIRGCASLSGQTEEADHDK